MTAAVIAFRQRTFRSLRTHRNYRLFFAGQIVSVTGSWMQNVALAWFVIQLSGSPLAVGALVLCRFLPFTVLGLVAGAVADRMDTRTLVIRSQAAQMVISVGLAATALTGTATLPIVYALAALGGVALAFDAPGRQALTFRLVGRDELPNAVALNSSLFNLSRVAGPAIGGVLVAVLGVGACFALNALSFLAVLAALVAIDVDSLFPVERASGHSLLRGIREGFAFAWRTKELRIVLVVVTVASSVGFNFHVVVPLLASQTLHAGPEVFGILAASFGLGAFVGAIGSAGLGRESWKAFLLGAAGFGVTLLGLATVTTAWLACVLLFATGLAFTLVTANGNSIVQLSAPGHLRGRMIGLYLFAFAGLTPLGGLVTSWLVDIGGTPLGFGVAGVAGLAVTAWAARQRALLVASR